MSPQFRQNRLALWVLLLLGPVITWADAAVLAVTIPERITWQKTPIRLALTVGTEQRVDFPGPVKVGVPATIQAVLRVQSVAGTVYLLAHQPFEPTRVLVRTIDSGAVYLLDLSARDAGGASPPIEIRDPEAGGSEPVANHAEQSAGLPAYGYVALTRFAAQQLYAPARLLKGLPGVVRVPVRRGAVSLLRGGQVMAEPWVAWRAGDLYVTAVKLTNQAEQAVTLDPRALRGDWLTVAFQHNRLLPRGDEADTTAVYLISARPFEASL